MEDRRSVEIKKGKVKDLRTKQCWTQEELARQAKVTPQIISYMERGGERRFFLETVRLVADALGVSPCTLVDDGSGPLQQAQTFDDLLALAKPTDLIWPALTTRGVIPPYEEPPPPPCFPRASRLCIGTRFPREVYLVLLDKGSDGLIYCLCPSWLAPRMFLKPGESLPQPEALAPKVFVAQGIGREHLLAITTDRPLELDWQPANPRNGLARCLDLQDIATLKAQLLKLRSEHRQLHKTYFDVIEAPSTGRLL